MAIASRKEESPYILIHHSDRGFQYCCSDYVSLLEAENIAISTTQTGSPYDNAQAERVNETVKNEFFPKRPTAITRKLKRRLLESLPFTTRNGLTPV